MHDWLNAVQYYNDTKLQAQVEKKQAVYSIEHC